jgi:hypothetical protein
VYTGDGDFIDANYWIANFLLIVFKLAQLYFRVKLSRYLQDFAQRFILSQEKL